MSVFYSHSARGFYPVDHLPDYEAAGTWPDDAIELTNDEYASLRAGLAAGKIIKIGSDGRPVLVDPPPPPLETVKTSAIATINSAYQSQIIALTGNVPDAERATWPLQQAAAEAHLAGTATVEQSALLTSLRVGDETMDVLAQKITRKAAAVQQLIGVALGLKRRTEKAVEAAPDHAAVEAALTTAKAEMEAAIAALSGGAA